MKIKELPAAQKRTSKHKKFVHVGDQYVYKGPYSPNDNSFINCKRFLSMLKFFEDRLQVPVEYRSHLDIIDEIEHRDGIFLKYKNVGDPSTEKEHALVSTKIDKEYKVLPRNSFVSRVSDLEQQSGLTEKIAVAVLQHLYCAYILGIGDVGSHNILVCKTGPQFIAGIDIEEKRHEHITGRPSDVMSALFNRPSKAQTELYAPYLHRLGKDVHVFSDFDAEIHTNLKKVGGDSISMEGRMIHFNNLIKKMKKKDEKLVD